MSWAGMGGRLGLPEKVEPARQEEKQVVYSRSRCCHHRCGEPIGLCLSLYISTSLKYFIKDEGGNSPRGRLSLSKL